MKKIAANVAKLIILLSAAAVTFLVFKLDKSWFLTLLFAYNFIIISSYILMGSGASIAMLVVGIGAYVVVVMKSLALELNVAPFAAEFAVMLAAYILVRQVSDTNRYHLFNVIDEIKALEGEYNSLLIERKNIKTALGANKKKLEKYIKLEEIVDGLNNHNMFSGKIRHVLRNVISLFHRDHSIVLFLTKDGKFMKIEANKEDDMVSGEKDQESLFLKNFDEWIIQNKRSIIISDMQREIRFTRDKNDRTRSFIGVPVFSGEGIAGILRISSTEPGSFTQEDLRFLDLIAEMSGRILKEEGYA